MSYAISGYSMRPYSDGTGFQSGTAFIGTARVTPAGVLVLLALHRTAAWQIDENFGFAAVVSLDGAWVVDENIILATATLSKDAVLQADENVLVKAAPPVTSY